jgi:copper homeostasis protein
MPKVEIAVTNLAEALAAARGGAHSVEISVDLAADGLTPPLEIVAAICAALPLEIHVIIRPHNRDFVYTAAEKALMFAQMDALTPFPIHGIVIGGHDAAGNFDVPFLETVVQRYPHWIITLHRALDHCANAESALAALQGKAHRILVSGKAPTAYEGCAILREWVQTFGAQYRIVAAGKITLENAVTIAQLTGVQEIHTASAVRTAGMVAVDKVRRLVERLTL